MWPNVYCMRISMFVVVIVLWKLWFLKNAFSVCIHFYNPLLMFKFKLKMPKTVQKVNVEAKYNEIQGSMLWSSTYFKTI